VSPRTLEGIADQGGWGKLGYQCSLQGCVVCLQLGARARRTCQLAAGAADFQAAGDEVASAACAADGRHEGFLLAPRCDALQADYALEEAHRTLGPALSRIERIAA